MPSVSGVFFPSFMFVMVACPLVGTDRSSRIDVDHRNAGDRSLGVVGGLVVPGQRTGASQSHKDLEDVLVVRSDIRQIRSLVVVPLGDQIVQTDTLLSVSMISILLPARPALRR